MERAFARANVTIACDGDDPDQLFGFVVHELVAMVHWVYVKAPFRRMGIARKMLEPIEGHITLRWPTKHLGRPATWDPFAFEE